MLQFDEKHTLFRKNRNFKPFRRVLATRFHEFRKSFVYHVCPPAFTMKYECQGTKLVVPVANLG